MKKLNFTILFFLIITCVLSQNEWTKIHPYPTNDNMYDVHFNSEQEGWIVGYGGLILYTNNGGTTWTNQQTNSESTNNSVFFIDENEGWTASYNAVYHTTNKGTTWNLQDVPVSNVVLNNIHFIDKNIGFAVGDFETILRTTNGGEDWTKVWSSNSYKDILNDIQFIDNMRGWVVGGRTQVDTAIMYSTNDGGITWNNITPTNCHMLTKVHFFDSITGLVCGLNDRIRKTYDGGLNWDPIDKVVHCIDLQFFDNNNGILLEPGNMLRTFDAGNTWDSVSVISYGGWLKAMDFLSNNFGIAVGGGGEITKTTNGGLTWEIIGSTIKSNIYNCGFFNEYSGLAIANNQLIKSDDGGYNWATDTTINNEPFNSMYLKNDFCYLLNSSKQLYKTLDSGNTWTQINAPLVANNYNDMYFINPTIGFLCGDEGVIEKTIDGGLNWSNISTDSLYTLNFVFFIDENNGWTIDQLNQTLLNTNNSGDDWNIVSISTTNTYTPTSVWFTDQNNGYISTYEGILFHTINGGETWEEFFVFQQSADSRIVFVSENEGWYKTRTKIYHTKDGGISWNNEQSFGVGINNMFFIGNKYGWLCAENGVVATYDYSVNIDDNIVPSNIISVYPNPTSDFFTIRLNDNSDILIGVKIYDLNGDVVRIYNEFNNLNSTVINTQQLLHGTYIISVISNENEFMTKLIIN